MVSSRDIAEAALELWQLPQNALGLAVYAFCSDSPSGLHRGKRVTFWRSRSSSLSLGHFIFLAEQFYRLEEKDLSYLDEEPVFLHEYGHTLQSAALGPLYLAVIGIPSFIWAKAPVFKRMREEGRDYYSFFIEAHASKLGKARVEEEGTWTTAS